MNIVIGDQTLKVPAAAARQLRGKRLEVRETEDGLLIKPHRDPVKEFTGSLAGKVSLADFLRDREAEVDLDR